MDSSVVFRMLSKIQLLLVLILGSPFYDGFCMGEGNKLGFHVKSYKVCKLLPNKGKFNLMKVDIYSPDKGEKLCTFS